MKEKKEAQKHENIIITDANFLIYAIEKRIRLEEIYDIIEGKCTFAMPEKVRRELERIASKKSRESKYARVALILPIKVIAAKGRTADEQVLNAALSISNLNKDYLTAYIITNDKKLIINAKKNGIGVITVKGLKGFSIA
ncbi:MAG: hypothetical protein QXI89_00720 [Candidatus Anstonellales archaeon]